MRASCAALPIFLRAALLLLGRESFLPCVGDLWVVASEGEAFHSFESAGNRVVGRHVRA